MLHQDVKGQTEFLSIYPVLHRYGYILTVCKMQSYYWTVSSQDLYRYTVPAVKGQR